MRLAVLFMLCLLLPFAARADGMIESRLYFGLENSDGSQVSETDWASFLAEQVTPRFPDGLTVIDAYGQWRNQKAETVRERSKLLVIVHLKTEKAAQDLAALKSAYLQRFQQTSVFHTESPVHIVE